jgi:hypothetical protein
MSKLTGVSRQRDDYDTSVPARRRGSNHSDHESYESPTAPREDHLLLESAARLGHGDRLFPADARPVVSDDPTQR